ncbi:MAG: DUF1365 domain-containing protein [Acidimicrobiia bacterium]
MTPLAAYEGTVAHRRFGPHARTFAPRVLMAYLDVDALPDSLDDLPGWSGRRPAPVHFRNRDFLTGQDFPLGPAVRSLVEDRLGRMPTGPIFLLAHLRTFGWIFNPLAVYYCWDEAGLALDAIVLEVTNTPWNERQWYVFDARTGSEATAPKAMYVSPFLPMGLDYRVSWTTPGPGIDLSITVTRDARPLLRAELTLRRSVLNRSASLRLIARHPLAPLRGSAEIYRKALKLWMDHAPLYRHSKPAKTMLT